MNNRAVTCDIELALKMKTGRSWAADLLAALDNAIANVILPTELITEMLNALCAADIVVSDPSPTNIKLLETTLNAIAINSEIAKQKIPSLQTTPISNRSVPDYGGKENH